MSIAGESQPTTLTVGVTADAEPFGPGIRTDSMIIRPPPANPAALTTASGQTLHLTRNRHEVPAATAIVLALLAGLDQPLLAQSDEVEAREAFGFGVEWEYLEPGIAPPPGWATTIDGEVEEESIWQVGRSPFLARSEAVQAELERNIRQLPRRQRRQRLAQLRSFEGTRWLYDSEAYPAPEGMPDVYEPGPNGVHFARSFFVEGPDRPVSALLEVRFSGGFIAYLNGREWVRHNVDPATDASMPATIVWQPEWVEQTVGNVWQRAYVGLPTELLREGENRLAFEVRRRADGASRAFYFDARLVFFDRHGFIQTPYLGELSTDSVTVMWQTTVRSLGYVEYGSGPGLGRVAVAAEPASTVHEVTLTDLVPDTRYYYRVHSLPAMEDGRPEGMLTSPIHHFHTDPGRGRPCTFLAYGDSRTEIDEHARLVRLMEETVGELEPTLLINTGDLTTSGSSFDEWQAEFFEPLLPFIDQVPLFTVPGNHEYNHESYYENLALPNNEVWYQFSCGDADFFALNTSSDFSPGSDQLRWFDEALAASTATWKIAVFHYPAYSCVESRKPGHEDVRAYLLPLIERHGVDLVLSGHDHLYGRSIPINGTTFVITGGGGAPTYSGETDRFNIICERKRHFLFVRVDPDSLAFDTISIDGDVMDSVTLTR